MLVKFDQNCMIQTTQNFELFDKKKKTKNKKKNKQTNKQTKKKEKQNKTKQNKSKNKNKNGFFKTIFDEALTTFWTKFLLLKQLLNAKLLISRLPSFSVSKITIVRHVQPG